MNRWTTAPLASSSLCASDGGKGVTNSFAGSVGKNGGSGAVFLRAISGVCPEARGVGYAENLGASNDVCPREYVFDGKDEILSAKDFDSGRMVPGVISSILESSREPDPVEYFTEGECGVAKYSLKGDSCGTVRRRGGMAVTSSANVVCRKGVYSSDNSCCTPTSLFFPFESTSSPGSSSSVPGKGIDPSTLYLSLIHI